MRQSQIRKTNTFVGSLAKLRVESIWAADDKSDVTAPQLPLFESIGQGGCAQAGATLIQSYHARAFGNRLFDAFALRRIELLYGLGAARFGFDGFELDFELMGEALGVIIPGRLGPVGHPLANGNNQQPHKSLKPCVLQVSWPMPSWLLLF